MTDDLRVLCVDDDEDICIILKLALSLDRAIDVEVVSSVEAALTVLLADLWRPDVLLLDARMPGVDGRHLYEKIRQIPTYAATPILFLTADVSAASVAELEALGARGVLPKPFDPTTLAGDLRRALRTKA